MATKFKELSVGDTFNFIPDRADGHLEASFYDRCEKTGKRTYKSLYRNDPRAYRVGTISVNVYHVALKLEDA